METGKTVTVTAALEPAAKDLSSVVVSSTGAGSDKNIRLMKKNANPLVNIISAKNIQLLPDITVANVLQRVSGVTIEKRQRRSPLPYHQGMEKDTSIRW